MKVIVLWDVILGPSPDTYHSFGRESASASFIVEEEFEIVDYFLSFICSRIQTTWKCLPPT